ncbi:MAG: sterol desaturase family protein [Rhodospirillales bacterium]
MTDTQPEVRPAAGEQPEGPVQRFVAYASYPLILALGFAVFSQIKDAVHLTLAAYISVLVCAVFITLHEIGLPARREWRPSGRDFMNDVVFMAVVQGALPVFLGLTFVIAVADLLQGAGLTVSGVWPHTLPVWAQVCLMLLAADFLRYWLHRAFHRVTPMWRLHAVHHSPHKLYWVNVGRFHPIEKFIQYCFDALPFAVIGVAPEVLAAYFVFYGTNGFFQHSNCLVRLGPLNYIVAGPELHRWHHSKSPEESDRNFGNNLIVWDLVFGTRFLPKDREVGDIGLTNRNYPDSFLAQMKTPFIPGLDQG